MSRLAGHARDLARARPATALLGASLAGLVLGPRHPPALAVAAATIGLLCRTPRRALVLLAALLAGAELADLRAHALDRTTLGPQLGHVVRVRAPLTESARTTRAGWRAVVRLAGDDVLLRGRGAVPAFPVGRQLDLGGVLRRPAPHESWLRPRHIHAVLEARSVSDTGAGRSGLTGALDMVRARAQRALEQRLPPPEAALLRGMVLGDDAGLDVVERERLRRAGLGHLVAASGANVALLATLALACCALAGVGLRGRLLVVLGLIAVYVPLAGAGPSIQRAGIMGAAAVVATLAGRPAARLHAVLLAAVVTLALDPAALLDPGWQLSFAAVIAIAALAAPVRAVLLRRGAPQVVAEGCALTLAATIGTAPVSAAVFGTVSLAGLLANVLVVPLVGPITWAGMVAALAAQAVPAAGATVAWVAGPALATVLAVGRACADLPAAQLRAPAVVVTALATLAAVVILVPVARRVAAGLAPLLALAGLLAAVTLRPRALPPPPAGTVRFAFLDIGQGDATLVQSGAHALLVDAGPSGGPVLARLRDLGVNRLDVFAGTHAQADHIGGADAVVRDLAVDAVLDGRDGVREIQGDELVAAAATRAVPMVPARAGQRLRIGAATAEVLWPPDDERPQPGADPNDRAIVLRVTGGGVRVLLTADAESGVLARIDPGPIDVLKVSHHGSADPGLPALLERLRPRLAVIEVGAGNPYGHPAPQALAALRAARVPTRRTDGDGTVVVDASRGRLHVQTRS